MMMKIINVFLRLCCLWRVTNRKFAALFSLRVTQVDIKGVRSTYRVEEVDSLLAYVVFRLQNKSQLSLVHPVVERCCYKGRRNSKGRETSCTIQS